MSLGRGAALLRFARKQELGDAVKVALLASGRVSENSWWLLCMLAAYKFTTSIKTACELLNLLVSLGCLF